MFARTLSNVWNHRGIAGASIALAALGMACAAPLAYSQTSNDPQNAPVIQVQNAPATAPVAAPAEGNAATDEFKITHELNNRFREETRLVLAYMSSRHYGDKNIDEIDSREMIAAYMKDLDYSKAFFVQADIDAINERFAGPLKSEYLTKGNLYPAFEIFRLYRQRAHDRFAWVFNRLNQKFDFSTNETFRPDRHDLEWPKSQLEVDQLWECRLKYEMLDGLLNGESLEQTRDRLVHRYQRMERSVNEFEPYDVEERFLDSFTTLFDPHSNFMSVETADNFSIAISNSLQGIGALLMAEDGYCTISELIPGGPAELSGLVNPGDKIVSVAQANEEPVDVVDMKLSKVVKLIRGPKGSEVRLTIVPANNPSGRKEIHIVRDEIRLTEQLAKAWLIQIPNPDGGAPTPVGVIDLPSFYGADPDDGPDAPTTSRDVQELLIKLKAKGAKAIVLDLRRNGGGLLSEAIRLSGLFIKDGPVVQVRYDNGKIRADYDDDNDLCVYDGPLVVLVSRNSASASEICAGALQVLNRAVIVGGKTTHGKGTVQQTMPLNSMRQMLNPFGETQELGMLKITIQKFYLPDGASTQERGVKSDIAIPSINEFLPIGETDLDHYLPWDSIAPTLWNKANVIAPGGVVVTPALNAKLNAASQQRMAKLPEFDFLKQSIARFKTIDDKKDISVNEAVRRKERDDDKAFRNRMEDWMDKMKADNSYPRESILLALSLKQNATHQAQLHEGVLPNGRPRANNFYQKIYYYEDASKEIHPIKVELINYESAIRKSADVADVMSKVLGQKVTPETAKEVLQHLQSSDPGSNFNVEDTFAEYMPKLPAGALDSLLPAFFNKLVELDPDVIDDEARFDIDMREAARVSADWVSLLGKGEAPTAPR
jgi:carboxyl-terminal processing protease